ncbi:CPBP family intramembrane glutamic endopeptidase [Changchengzhania lutea]|uniref:CPBP family intramembrane glutamic endopeptidase n=1 Tax=Changchengzhania lutea TaxID=2049305 RepID=UPI00115ECD33|nr:CPBP family intramembrane glutamic endopeptidase [Changchengzhania lutea]
MKTLTYRGLEFLIIFILLPVSFTINYSIWVKLLLGVFGFVYIIFVLLKVHNIKFKVAPHLNWKAFWKHTLFKGIVIATITIIFVWITDKSLLFHVVWNKPMLWVIIVVLYSVFSVYPQELIYRTFFFERYRSVFKSDDLFIFINALVFALAHVLFKNVLVLILTFFGGLLFAITYRKTQSTLLVSIEHAIYGSCLFTVGMGEMLGFPV